MMMAGFETPTAGFERRQLVHESVDDVRPPCSFHRPRADIDFRVTVGMFRFRARPAAPVIVAVYVEHDEHAESSAHVRVDSMQLCIEVIILFQGSLDQTVVWSFLPDFQAPGVIGFHVNRPFARPVQVYLEAGFPRDNVVSEGLRQRAGVRILFPQAVTFTDVQQIGNFRADTVPVVYGGCNQRFVVVDNVPNHIFHRY